MTDIDTQSLKDRCRGISLGIFAGDPGHLRGNAVDAAQWGCGILHFDVMDGVFVPQISGGPAFVKALAGDMIMDVHLMVRRQKEQVAGFASAGADIITIHAESDDPAGALQEIRAEARKAGRPILAGLCLLPATAIDDIQPLLDPKPDLVLVAALDPRTGDPADVGSACRRVVDLRQRFGPDGPLIAFDGGVTADTIATIAEAAPDLVVSGSAIMRAADPASAFRNMRDAL